MNNNVCQPESLLERKHVIPVLQALYRSKSMRQKDLAGELGVSKGVICLLMDVLSSAGLVRQCKYGRCKLYVLLPQGALLLEACKLTPVAEEQRPLSEEARRILSDWVGGDMEKLRAALERDSARIDRALDRLSAERPDPALLQHVRKSTEPAARLTRALEELARAGGGTAYLRMGACQARLEQLEKELSRRRPATGRVRRTRHTDAILELLYRRGPLSAGELGEALAIGASKVRPHMEPMVAAGLVEERLGSALLYSLTASGRRVWEAATCEAPGK